MNIPNTTDEVQSAKACGKVLDEVPTPMKFLDTRVSIDLYSDTVQESRLLDQAQ